MYAESLCLYLGIPAKSGFNVTGTPDGSTTMSSMTVSFHEASAICGKSIFFSFTTVTVFAKTDYSCKYSIPVDQNAYNYYYVIVLMSMISYQQRITLYQQRMTSLISGYYRLR
jgi:hypothetical protein